MVLVLVSVLPTVAAADPAADVAVVVPLSVDVAYPILLAAAADPAAEAFPIHSAADLDLDRTAGIHYIAAVAAECHDHARFLFQLEECPLLRVPLRHIHTVYFLRSVYSQQMHHWNIVQMLAADPVIVAVLAQLLPPWN